MENSRRSFIKQTLKKSALVAIGIAGAETIVSALGQTPGNIQIKNNVGFDQTPLPYSYNALEDIIDAQTMEIHYSKHAAAYAKNAKEAAIAEKYDINQPIEYLLKSISKYSSKLRNNAGGHYNHEMFWRCMRPKVEGNKPGNMVLEEIDYSFGGFDTFKAQFTEAAKSRFGSGWAWLYKAGGSELKIGSTPNQDNPLMDIQGQEVKGTPLLCLDVWEHAYYLKYQNKRADYIENWWKLVNWDFVEQLMRM